MGETVRETHLHPVVQPRVHVAVERAQRRVEEVVVQPEGVHQHHGVGSDLAQQHLHPCDFKMSTYRRSISPIGTLLGATFHTDLHLLVHGRHLGRAQVAVLLHPTPTHPLMVTRFAASLPTDNSPQPKEAQPLSHALTSDLNRTRKSPMSSSMPESACSASRR